MTNWLFRFVSFVNYKQNLSQERLINLLYSIVQHCFVLYLYVCSGTDFLYVYIIGDHVFANLDLDVY